MHFILLLIPFVMITTSEIIDYSNHEFFLFKDKKDVLIYESYADLFHVTNLSFYEEIINLESGYVRKDTNKYYLRNTDTGINSFTTDTN